MKRKAKKRDKKSRAGSLKPALHLVPASACILESLALKEGAAKYGAFNWRETPIEIMEHIGAAQRHIARYVDREDIDPKNGVHALASARATLGILIDAIGCGKVLDDRPAPGAAPRLIEALTIKPKKRKRRRQ